VNKASGSQPIPEGKLLWQPSELVKAKANISRYMAWLNETRGLTFGSYQALWDWSVTDLEGFWVSIWDFFQIKAHNAYTEVLQNRKMPGANWFVGARLNYAEHALSRRDDHPAVIFQSEASEQRIITYRDLYRQVAAIAGGLRALGVKKGDRVVAVLPNIPENLVAFLATVSIGAIWSSCAPEFGTHSVVERFQQIEPTVLLTVDGYQYGGTIYSRIEALAQIQRELSTLKHTILVPYLPSSLESNQVPDAIWWDEIFTDVEEVAFEAVPFDHPLWVLYSSGTTGLPKAIVHGHGGILLEHFKSLSLHLDLTPQDRFFWYTTTGWMMWNFVIGGLLLGSTILLYDGNAVYPDIKALWQFAEQTEMTYFGISASYIQACMRSDIKPGDQFNLGHLRGMGSTGAPLSPEGFAWVYNNVKQDILLGSVSGGTDVCTPFVGSCPLLPVNAGEIQCLQLGARVEAYDGGGISLTDEVGELVLTEPMPSMPIFLWNDLDGARYIESYFQAFPGVWRHGDWIKITPHASCVVYGRSDSTLNRGGVRMGTSEFYRVVEDIPEVIDSLVVDTGSLGKEGRILLFVILDDGRQLNESLINRIKGKLRADLSPRHVPDEIYVVPDIPKTINGKKLEVPVKRILMGMPLDQVVSKDAMSNPEVLSVFVDLARI
jgi:acetoacetyl-CoA synthetase